MCPKVNTAQHLKNVHISLFTASLTKPVTTGAWSCQPTTKRCSLASLPPPTPVEPDAGRTRRELDAATALCGNLVRCNRKITNTHPSLTKQAQYATRVAQGTHVFRFARSFPDQIGHDVQPLAITDEEAALFGVVAAADADRTRREFDAVAVEEATDELRAAEGVECLPLSSREVDELLGSHAQHKRFHNYYHVKCRPKSTAGANHRVVGSGEERHARGGAGQP